MFMQDLQIFILGSGFRRSYVVFIDLALSDRLEGKNPALQKSSVMRS